MLKTCFVAAAICAVLVQANVRYELDFDKCDIVDYNKTMISNWKMTFNKLNRTTFSVTSDADLLVPVNLDIIKATGQVYTFEDGNYVVKPHLKMTIGTCNEYKMQTIAAWKEIENHGNLRGCGQLEPQHIHVKDWIPKVKLLDVDVPKGKYKVNVKLHMEEVFIFELDFYSHIESIQ